MMIGALNMGTTFIKTLNISIPFTEENIAEIEGLQINTDDLKVIIKHGFFGFKQGSMTIHRDVNGKLRKLEKEFVYSKNNKEQKIEKYLFYI